MSFIHFTPGPANWYFKNIVFRKIDYHSLRKALLLTDVSMLPCSEVYRIQPKLLFDATQLFLRLYCPSPKFPVLN